MHLLLALSLLSCKPDPDETDAVPSKPSPLLGVEETESWEIEGMTSSAYVIRTEMNIPHIYAENHGDLGRAVGFTMARDRFFEMDLIRRLATGTLSEILGDIALEADMESRGTGMTFAAEQHLKSMAKDPELSEYADGFAQGVNAYIDQVEVGLLPAPSELVVGAPLLGATHPSDLMHDYSRADVAASLATFLYISGFETDDIQRTDKAASLAAVFDGAPLQELREAGLYEDLWDNPTPPNLIGSSQGWGLKEGEEDPVVNRAKRPARFPTPAHAPESLIRRASERLSAFEAKFGRDIDAGFGSNAWAVAGSSSASGNALFAGDGHLALTTPNYFWQMGIDTEHLGGGNLHVTGLAVPGMPQVATGTNGRIAWTSTQFGGDITDWYAEKITLGGDGKPTHSLFNGENKELIAVDEVFVVADVPALESTGRTETWARWMTFDGRWIADIEGDEVSADSSAEAGQSVVMVQGSFVIPRDVDGDGVITAISFAYTGLTEGVDGAQLFHSWNTADDVEEFRDAQRGAVATSLNWVAADYAGSIYYSGYQAIPCRAYLPRDTDNVWIDGADPRMLLDGTKYGSFTIPMDGGRVDESSIDADKCVVPFKGFPSSINPAKGYLQTANNDPGWITTDGSIYNDPHYLGGPWLEGFRAARISKLLEEHIAAGTASLETMAEVQGDHHSIMGETYAWLVLEAIDLAQDLEDTADEDWELRLVDLYQADSERFDEVYERITDWTAADFPARSGVETFYNPVEAGDLEHSVATTIHQAWLSAFNNQAQNDEGIPGLDPGGDTHRTRVFQQMIHGRGADNPLDLASWNPETEEPVWWDHQATEEIEHSQEIALLALTEALDFLESDPVDGWQGGYGTQNMDEWLWGLRHLVKFQSTVGDFIEDDDYSFLTEPLEINTTRLPLAQGMAADDPRADLPWFPRHGDHLNIDAGNTGFDNSWSYGSGPTFRMVVDLDQDHPTGINILPGGQSGITDSEHFSDQSELWLGNQTVPMHITVEDVIANAVGRETFK
jgi:penicillin G amidase